MVAFLIGGFVAVIQTCPQAPALSPEQHLVPVLGA